MGKDKKSPGARRETLKKEKKTPNSENVCCKLGKQTGLIKNEYLNIQMNETENIFSLLFSSTLAMAHQHFLRPPISCKKQAKKKELKNNFIEMWSSKNNNNNKPP